MRVRECTTPWLCIFSAMMVRGAGPQSSVRLSLVLPMILPSLPPCARAILSSGAQRLVPLRAALSTPLVPVDHIYLVHYTRAALRLSYQLVQLPRLGLNISIVVPYDREEIDERILSCTALVDRRIAMQDSNRSIVTEPAYLSQSLKLYVALFDMVERGWRVAMIIEDDARIRWEILPTFAQAVRNATEGIDPTQWLHPLPSRNGFTVLFSGSYNPDGHDGFCCVDGPRAHIVRAKPRHWRRHGLMAIVGAAITAAGARHVVRSLPITDGYDVMLSDSRVASGSQAGQWVLKPYAFVPAAELQQGKIFTQDDARAVAEREERRAQKRRSQPSARRARACDSEKSRAVNEKSRG